VTFGMNGVFSVYRASLVGLGGVWTAHTIPVSAPERRASPWEHASRTPSQLGADSMPPESRHRPDQGRDPQPGLQCPSVGTQ
jgi:hypothetical protein